jgi:hypothetical protein
MRESQQLVIGLRLVSKEFQHSAIQTRIEQHFGGFFHQINVRQPIGRKDSIQTVILTSRRLDSLLYEAAQNLEVFQIFESEIKKSKTKAVDVFFKAYPMVPLSCRSNLAGRYRTFKTCIFFCQEILGNGKIQVQLMDQSRNHVSVA